MISLLRRRLFFRVILNGIILVVVSAGGFLALATALVGGETRDAERAMATWFAEEACTAYAASPHAAALATYPVGIAIYARSGERLAASTTEDLGEPTTAEVERATAGSPTTIAARGDLVRACLDGSARYVVVGRPLKRPPINRLAVSVGAMVLLVVLGSIPLARSLVKPIRELVGTATRFGEGDLSARATVRRADEIGELATAFNAMAAKLESKLRAEKEMLANVSHELRTPLARVRVVLETAQEDPKRAASLLTEISRDLAELERLTETVLATVRLDFEERERAEPPGLRFHAEEVDVMTLLRHVIAWNVEANPEVEIALEGPENMRSLRADPALLRRLFDNLVGNARKYSSDPVSVRAHEDDDVVVVVVEDHGIGIDEADLERIFEPFFRSDRSRQRTTGGTGIGLALCRRIVELHGGTIEAASAGGAGTKITVRLPRAPRSGETKRQST